jgi:hypothetical protein
MRKYVIINTSDLSAVDFNQVLEADETKLRYSVDGTKTFVKYEEEQPSSLTGKTEHTNSEILAILAGDEWTTEQQD